MEKIISTEIISSHRIFDVEHSIVETPQGKQEKRSYVRLQAGAVIIPIDEDGRILLIREFRSAAGKKILLLPGGGIDQNETPEQAAIRELREEIGMSASTIKLLCHYETHSAWLKHDQYFFVATQLYPSPLDTGDEFEKLEVVPVTHDQALALIENGEIHGDYAVILLRFIKGNLKV